MRTSLLAVMSLLTSVGLCQTPAKAPDTLQSLLAEVHQLRQDIEAMTVASQRVQIALSVLQIQDLAVARAAQRADDARNKCAAAEANRQHAALEIQNWESVAADSSTGDDKTKAFQQALTHAKIELEARTAEVQACQAVEAEAAGQLRNDQGKLAELQERIERLDQNLEKLTTAGK